MKKILTFLIFLYKHFLATSCLTRASALAFTTILSLVPLMVVAVSILSLLPISQILQQHIQEFIFSNFIVSSGHVILSYLEMFVKRVHELSLLSVLFLMVTAVSMLFSIEGSLNAIWCIDDYRTWYRAIVFYFLILMLGPLLIVLSLIFSFFIIAVVGNTISQPLTSLFVDSLPLLLSFCGYLIMYKVMPYCYVPWRSAVIGAIFSAISFEIAKVIFAWYIAAFPTYTIIYGAVAAFPIFLIWVYICWLIFLLGAAISYTVRNKYWIFA